MTQDPILWLGFNLFVLAMLALDLGIFHRKAHAVSFKEAASWSVFWISLALAFNWGIYSWHGEQAGTEFLTGYFIEKSLSVDNIFVFLTIFAYFKIPPIYQHKVLFWGILGALLMRAGFIFAGIALIQRFHWLIYVFGVFLIFTAIKMLFQHGKEVDLDKTVVIRFFRRMIPVTPDLRGSKFVLRENGRWVATPLLVCLFIVEISDLIFAIDSIPAILAITNDPFIVYTSNVFAILGLRSLYFALAGAMEMFVYLHYGLAAILAFVGIKMLLTDIYKIPISWALGIIAVLLVLPIIASILVRNSKNTHKN